MSDRSDHRPDGRFSAGNGAWRRRAVKAVADGERRAEILGLKPEDCEAWLKPTAVYAVQHATELLSEIPRQTEGLAALADDIAVSRAIARGLVALGAKGDRKALTDARAWLREARQGFVTLTAIARLDAGEGAGPIDAAAWAKMAEDAGEPVTPAEEPDAAPGEVEASGEPKEPST